MLSSACSTLARGTLEVRDICIVVGPITVGIHGYLYNWEVEDEEICRDNDLASSDCYAARAVRCTAEVLVTTACASVQ